MEPTSPQPSVDRLSVTFVVDEKSVKDNNEGTGFKGKRPRNLIIENVDATKNSQTMQRGLSIIGQYYHNLIFSARYSEIIFNRILKIHFL